MGFLSTTKKLVHELILWQINGWFYDRLIYIIFDLVFWAQNARIFSNISSFTTNYQVSVLYQGYKCIY